MATASESDFVAHLLELLAPAGEVVARRMFGGHGIFHDGLMFGLVADGIFYLKVDEVNRPEFDALNLPPFRYEGKNGKVAVMSYCQCPETALDGADRMLPWARSAMAAAERNRKPKTGTRKR